MVRPPRKFAQGTTVSEDSTLKQIKANLKKAGAEGVLSLDRNNMAVIGFEFNHRAYRFDLPIPELSEFEYTITGRTRSEDLMISVWQQEVNRRWRALLDVIDGRLRSVLEGISTMERAFALEAVMPSGQTVGDVIYPQIEEAYQSGRMPRLLMPPSH